MAHLETAEKRVEMIINCLNPLVDSMVQPAAALIIKKFGKDPFLVLISCILSLRTRDPVSYAASCRLFMYATTAVQMLELPRDLIEKLIYPVGFYRRKAAQLQAICTYLLQNFDGKVPANKELLLLLPGVGLKTTNLVLAEAFDIPALVVDTHVHRLSNRLGLVSTKNAEQTEAALQKIVPKEHWILFTKLLVIWGQNICGPISPRCSICPLNPICPKIGVTHRR